MKIRWPLSLAALAALLTGCPHNEYEVELKPQGSKIERKFTAYRTEDTNEVLTAVDITAIEKLYSSGKTGIEDGKFVASGLFSGPMPADVGGAGSYTYLTNTVGCAAFYMERFRGEDDLVAMAQRRSKAADELADLAIGWAKAELGREPNFENLRKFLDTNVRHDLKNAGEYIAPFWIYESSLKSLIPDGVTNDISEQFVKGQMIRLGQYLVERDYLTAEDFHSVVFGNYGGMLGPRPLIKKLIAAKLGQSGTNAPPKSLAFLDSDDTLQESLDKYLKNTVFYRTKLAEWEKNDKKDPADESPKPSEFFGKLALAAGGLDDLEFLGTDDRLSVKLFLPSEPVESNGKWDENEKQVSWESDLHLKGVKSVLPVLCYASWSQADQAFQTKHFGGSVLTGPALIQYCLWRSDLSLKEAAEWDAMVASLTPGAMAKSKLEKFRFSDEATTTNEVTGATLVKTALEPKPEKK